MAVLLESVQDAVCCGKAVAIILLLERLDQDEVLVYMIYEHDEVVAAAVAEGESAHFVGVELANGLNPNIEFFGLGGGVRWRWDLVDRTTCRDFFYVTLEGFYGDRAVLGRVGGGEAWPGSVVACLDGCQPS